MEGAVVGGLVADEHGQVGRDAVAVGEGFGLEALRAVFQPVVLGHGLDQDDFRFGQRLVFGGEALAEGLEFGDVFAVDDDAAGSEAVFEGILARASAAFGVVGPVDCCALA